MTSSRSAAPAGRRSAAGNPGARKAGKSDKPAAKSDRPVKHNGNGAAVGAAAPERDSDAAEQTMLLVGARIRAMRLRQQLTLRDVAERTGVSVSMLSMLERGVFLAPSAYEAGFLSSAHDEAVVEATLAAAREAFRDLAG